MATKTEKAKSELAAKLQESVKVAEKPKQVKTKVKALAKEAAKQPAPEVKTTVRRQATFPDSWIIRLTEKGKMNPKRPGTGGWQLYECYEKGSKGITVGAYVEKCKSTKRPTSGRSAIAWDLKRDWIKVTQN